MNGVNLKSPPNLNDHYIGELTAPVVLVEYGDYECLFSAETAPMMKDLIEKFSFNFCFIYRHFPNLKSHPNSGVAAVSAEAAGKQGKFWEMHDALFSHFNDLAGDKMLFLARDINLDMRLFLNDLEDENLARKVHEDFMDAKNNNLVHTPALFLNGIHLRDVPSYQELESNISYILGEKNINP